MTTADKIRALALTFAGHAQTDEDVISAHTSLAAARAFETALAIVEADAAEREAKGLVLVPREPTEDMCCAGHGEVAWCMADPEACRDIIGSRTCYQATADVYRAMISAAQEGADAQRDG